MWLRNWDDLKVLLALHQHQTMTEAAKSLDLNTTTISRRLERLTDEIGMTLFVRRGVTWQATATGAQLIEVAETIFGSIEKTDVNGHANETLQRRIKISAGLQIICDAISPRLESFLTEYPDICLELCEEKKSVAFGEADVRLSLEETIAGRLIRAQLGTVGYAVYAHESHRNKLIGYVEIVAAEPTSTQCTEMLKTQFQRPRLATSCLAEGIAIATEMPLALCLPTRFAKRQPAMTRMLPEVPATEFPVWATYHESRRLDPNIRLTIDFLSTCFAGRS